MLPVLADGNLIIARKIYNENPPLVLCIQFFFYQLYRNRLYTIGWETLFKALSGKKEPEKPQKTDINFVRQYFAKLKQNLDKKDLISNG